MDHHSLILPKSFSAHINIEFCNSVWSIKYIYVNMQINAAIWQFSDLRISVHPSMKSNNNFKRGDIISSVTKLYGEFLAWTFVNVFLLCYAISVFTCKTINASTSQKITHSEDRQTYQSKRKLTDSVAPYCRIKISKFPAFRLGDQVCSRIGTPKTLYISTLNQIIKNIVYPLALNYFN